MEYIGINSGSSYLLANKEYTVPKTESISNKKTLKKTTNNNFPSIRKKGDWSF